MVTRVLPMALLLAALAGCGQSTTQSVADLGLIERPTEVPAATDLVTTSQPVLVSDDGTGARLCFSANRQFGGTTTVKCSDADISDWSWADHEGDYEVSDGVRWGEFLLTGTYDGTAFTPAEVLPGSAYQPEGLPPFDIPCPEPEGGWQVQEPARVTLEHYMVLQRAAQRLPGYAFMVQSNRDGSLGTQSPSAAVVTVEVAEDPQGAEALLRKSWGGMLCVAEVEHSQAELVQVQRQLLGLPGLIEVGVGTPGNQVNLTVFNDDGRYQRWADKEYGPGLVRVSSVLQTVT